MEHAEFLDPVNQLRFDSDLAEKMAESAIWISPTLQPWTDYPRIGSLTQRREEGQFLQEEKQKLAPLEHRLDIMRKMLDYGMKDRLVAGTDSGVSNLAFGHLDCDFQLLEKIGFSPAETLTSATRISAEAIGMEKMIDTIEIGKKADLAAFGGDPSKDIGALSRIAAVFLGGQRVA